MEHFTGRLESIFGRHVRVEKSVVFAGHVAFERRCAIRQIVWHRYVSQKGLFGIADRDPTPIEKKKKKKTTEMKNLGRQLQLDDFIT